MIERLPPVEITRRGQKVPEDNEFELVYPERLAFDPQRFLPAKDLSHRGGLGTARTEHY